MLKNRLSVREKDEVFSGDAPRSGELTADFGVPEKSLREIKPPVDEYPIFPDAETEYGGSDLETLKKYRFLVRFCDFDPKLGSVECDFPKDMAGLYGMDAIERLGLDKKKYALYVSKAGYLLKAEGFDDKDEFEEAMRRVQRPSKVVWEPKRKPGLDDYKTARFELLLKLEFPREYLWTTKVKPRKEFNKRWSGEARKTLPSSGKPYVLSLNNGDALLKASGFSNPREFINACEELAEYAKISFPYCPRREIDDLVLDLPREWRHLPQKISGEAFFTGATYLGDRIRETLFPNEILYIILEIQKKVMEEGAVEAVQRFRSEDGVSVICSDTMRGNPDGWQMTVSRF